MFEAIPAKYIAAFVGVAALGALMAPALVQAAFNHESGMEQVAALITPSLGHRLDDSHLVKLAGDYFAVSQDGNVSNVPEATVRVRKIGFGRTSYVNIVTTSSGVYSSEGLVSSHIRYPGIHTEKLALAVVPFSGSIAGWSRLTGWVNIPLTSANSIGFLDDASVPASTNGVCVTDNHDGSCR